MQTVACDWCGDRIERYESQLSETNFCDQDCYAAYRSEEWIGEDHPSYQGATIVHECEVCGAEREIPRAWDRNPRFCSRECKATAERQERSDVRLGINPNGYDMIRTGNEKVRLNRLTAVAEHGWEAVVEKDHVHHVDGTPWLDFGLNLQPVTKAEHRRLHAQDHPTDPFTRKVQSL